MTIFTNHKTNTTDIPVIHGHRPHGGPVPPHARRNLIEIDFDEVDWNVMNDVFGDEDTAFAAAEVIRKAPPEIKILAIQLMNIIEKEA